MTTNRRMTVAFLITMLMVFCATPAATASIVNNNLSVVLEDGSRVTGMFAGDTGADEILTGNEVTSWMFDYTGSPNLQPFLLDSSSGDLLNIFEYDATSNTFTGPGFTVQSSPAPPFINYLPGSPTPWSIVDAQAFSYLPATGIDTFVPTITPKAAGQVPEPSSVLVWGLLGLITLTGGHWLRRRR